MVPEGEAEESPRPTPGDGQPAGPEPGSALDDGAATVAAPNVEHEAAERQRVESAAIVPLAPAHDEAPEPPGDQPHAEDVLRARVLSAGSPVTARAERARLTPAMLAAAILLVVSAGASLAFALARGGVALPTPQPTRGPVTEATASVTPSAAPSPAASLAPLPGAAASVAPSLAPTAAPTVAPSPTSDRYAVLVACPNKLDCWIYTIRQGDNLVSIASWFGVPLATIYEMNPGLRTTTIRAGMQIRIPTPTR